jgi:hypothetical protein
MLKACPICKTGEWLAAWPGILKCVWCGALYQIRTGRIVESGDRQRPAVREPLVEVEPQEFREVVYGERQEESFALGIERPEGWVYP